MSRSAGGGADLPARQPLLRDRSFIEYGVVPLRTAFALHLYTGQRRADVAHMAWTDVVGNAINVVQAKTGARLTIPLHPNLSAALRAWPRKHVDMLTTAFNRPFSDAGYGNMMADAIADAGLPDRCVLHGLRKAAARRLAEAGCSEKEIAAVTGHTTLKEVARYTRAADQKRLAAGAVAKLTEQKLDKNSQPSKSGLGKTKKRKIITVPIYVDGARGGNRTHTPCGTRF